MATRAVSSLDGGHGAAPGFVPGPAPLEPIARLETWQMHSAILPDDRTISVYLPEAYATEPGRRFPVLYLHDGQNLIDPHTAYIPGHTWRAGQTADRVVGEATAEPFLIVGVANTGLRRMAEYTPTRDYRMGGGEGSAYGRVLVEELKPFIDRTYRTQPDAASTGLGGSSLGGLISLYLGFEHPDVFTRLAILSPSIWWDQRSILSFVPARPVAGSRLWLDIGSGEGARHVRDTELLYRTLVEHGWQPGVEVEMLVADGAVHTEDAWAARLDRVFRFLFPARPA